MLIPQIAMRSNRRMSSPIRARGLSFQPSIEQERVAYGDERRGGQDHQGDDKIEP